MKMPRGFGAIGETFANRNYRLYVIGNLTSNIGLWIQRVAIGWLAWEMTRSTAWLGFVAAAEQGPTILFSLIAGTVLDRMDHFKLLRLTQACSVLYSVAMTVFTLLGWMDIWLLTALVLFRGVVIAFNRPSRMTVVYTLVGRQHLPSALAVNAMIFNSSRFIGPAIGGVLIAAAGNAGTFAAATALFLVFSWVLSVMEPPVEPRRTASIQRSLWAETIQGLNYIVSHDGIRKQLLLLAVTAFFAKPLTDLLPGFAGGVFDRGSQGLALLLGFHGAGAMLGGLWLSARGGLKGLTSITLANILLMAVALLLFTSTTIFWIACPAAALIGFAFVVQNVSNQTLIQSAVDTALRGRVLSLYGMVSQGIPALGGVTIGIVAEHTGLRLPVAIGGAVCLLLWAWSWRIRLPLAAALETERPAAHHLAG